VNGSAAFLVGQPSDEIDDSGNRAAQHQEEQKHDSGDN